MTKTAPISHEYLAWNKQVHDLILTTLHHRFEIAAHALDAMEKLLGAVSYKSVMARGYSITRTRRSGRLLRSAAEVREGERIITQLHDGTFESEIIYASQPTLFEEP